MAESRLTRRGVWHVLGGGALITLGVTDTPRNRELAESRLGNRVAVAKLFDDIGPRMAGRPGGYTRMYRLETRHGDGAPIVQIEILD